MPKKEISSIREGLRNMIQQMEAEKFSELSAKVEQQGAEIERLKSELSHSRGEISTLGEKKRGIEDTVHQKDQDIRSELSSIMQEVKNNRDDLSKLIKKTQDIKGVENVSEFKKKLEEVFSKKTEENKKEMVKLFEKFEEHKKELDVVFTNKLKDAQEIIKSLTDRTSGDIDEIKKLASLVKGFREDIEHYNLKKIVTGLEETRGRMQALESRLTAFQQIVDRIGEIESEIEGVKGSFPTILE